MILSRGTLRCANVPNSLLKLDLQSPALGKLFFIFVDADFRQQIGNLGFTSANGVLSSGSSSWGMEFRVWFPPAVPFEFCGLV